MISETVTHDLASAEVTDDCRVELWTDAPNTYLFPASARDLAAELVRAADEADKASAELLHNVIPAKFDERPWTPGGAA
ncbi:hypothetical protein CQ044_16670 [Microbacterium sp. MYb64]|nr:hypothetical protein CQ044_16670 [Microbacterium sp. MYb64]